MGKTTDTKKFSSGRLAAAVIAAGLVIAGCSAEEPEPDFTPTLPPSKSSSALDGDEPNSDSESGGTQISPEIPELNFQDIEPTEAAKILVDFFIAAYDYGYDTYDLEPLKAVSHPQCATCNLHMDRWVTQSNEGITSEGGHLQLKSIETFLVADDEVLAEALIQQDGWEDYDANAVKIDEEEATSKELGFVIRVHEGTWKIRAISDLGSGE